MPSNEPFIELRIVDPTVSLLVYILGCPLNSKRRIQQIHILVGTKHVESTPLISYAPFFQGDEPRSHKAAPARGPRMPTQQDIAYTIHTHIHIYM